MVLVTATTTLKQPIFYVTILCYLAANLFSTFSSPSLPGIPSLPLYSVFSSVFPVVFASQPLTVHPLSTPLPPKEDLGQ